MFRYLATSFGLAPSHAKKTRSGREVDSVDESNGEVEISAEGELFKGRPEGDKDEVGRREEDVLESLVGHRICCSESGVE